MWGAIINVVGSMFSGAAGAAGSAQQIEALNTEKVRQFEQNKAATAEMLSTALERTDRSVLEANRHAIRQKIAVAKARHIAEGEATVRAAQLGTGEGTRARLRTFRPAERMAADEITDININLETELINITEHFNDTASKMIAHLNNNTPYLGDVPGTTDILMSAAASGFKAYSNLSDVSKANIKASFSSGWNSMFSSQSGSTAASFERTSDDFGGMGGY